MPKSRRGKLKIFIGYAAGVGKTYKMLDEAQDLKSKGVDVVIGYFESHGRLETIAQSKGIETIPRRTIDYRGTQFGEMDTNGILARRPVVCIVDEFPHTNVPGCERSKRWEDVEAIRDAGIDVLTTMNVQHLESLNDQVWQITGIRVRETIPDWVVRQADEVVMVDLTPRALLHRLERGVVYGREKAEHALSNFFRESSLVSLRELTLRETAHEVEHRSESDNADTAHEQVLQQRSKQHKVLVLITQDPKTAMAIRRARRVSDFLGAECFAVVVSRAGHLSEMSKGERAAVEQHLNFARHLRIETRILEGDDAGVVIDFARRNRITQIFMTRPHTEKWGVWGRFDTMQRIIDNARDMQIVIVSDREPATR